MPGGRYLASHHVKHDLSERGFRQVPLSVPGDIARRVVSVVEVPLRAKKLPLEGVCALNGGNMPLGLSDQA